jgi:DNA-binding transcriptional regulator YiaG
MPNMQEHEYYNLYHSAARRGYEAEQASNQFALGLMIDHLREEHGMKVRDIARRLGVKQRIVSEHNWKKI